MGLRAWMGAGLLAGLISGSTAPAAAELQQNRQAPQTLTPFGSPPLPLAAEAARTGYLGLVEIYRVAVYADGTLSDRAHLLSPDTAKALRIEITYKDDLQHRITHDWRRELIPPMDPASTVQLFGAFAPLRDGDVILIQYVPRRGTAIYTNDLTVGSGGSHDLMLMFLEHWLGQHPVSEEMKKSLLGT